MIDDGVVSKQRLGEDGHRVRHTTAGDTGAWSCRLERRGVRNIAPVASGEIHLWLVADPEIQDRSLLTQYSEWLSESESARRKRFHFAKDRHQYLVTRASVRWALSSYIPSVREGEWRFVTGKYGRPAIADVVDGASDLQFNISHTKGLIVLAFSRDGEIGVDVEYLQRDGETAEIAEHFFSPREVTQLQALTAPKQRDRFFDLWTLKESYIKARGMGLSIPLDSFSFSFPADKSIDLRIEPPAGDRAEGWRFWQLSPTATHKIAVAYRNKRQEGHLALGVSRVIPGVSVVPAACRLLRWSDV